MNQDDCFRLVEEIRNISSGIEKFELGIIGKGDQVKELIQVTDLPSFQRATAQMMNEDSLTARTEESEEMSTISESTFGQMLGQIVDETGFIHEDKLIDILRSVQEPESNLIRFSNMLNVSETTS